MPFVAERLQILCEFCYFLRGQIMFFSGFADEAATGIAGQIAATRELGWEFIESRAVDKVNIHDLPEAEFEEVCGQLSDAGIRINCFGSTIANWAKEPFDEAGFAETRMQLERALVRMQRVGCKMLRAMSFHYLLDRPAFDPEVEKWVFDKVNILAKMCEDAGVQYGHENCMNYGGMSWKHTLKLLDNIKTPAFTLIFDTGNPVFNFDRSNGDALEKYQDSFEFYRNVREFISYVHIKDVYITPDPENPGKMIQHFTFPGEGDGRVREIVADLLKNGYDGGFSIEPHMATVFHDATVTNSDEFRFSNYVEYGHKFMDLISDVKKQLA